MNNMGIYQSTPEWSSTSFDSDNKELRNLCSNLDSDSSDLETDKMTTPTPTVTAAMLYLTWGVSQSPSHQTKMGPQIYSETCQLRQTGFERYICVCNSTFCDVIYEPDKLAAPNYVLYTTNKAGDRFTKTHGQFEPFNIENITYPVFVDSKTKYQEIFGFGGAISDSAGINIKKLSNRAQRSLMRSYFNKDGIEYTFIRVPIGASDFSTHLYTYDDSDVPDPDLLNFKLAPEDYDYKIPFIQEAISLSNNTVKIFGSLWSCPLWMKTIPEHASLFSELKDDMYQPLADYHIKFLDAYKQNNITFWGLTTSNEPMLGFIPIRIPNLGFTPQQLSNWIANNLGPTIRNSEYSDIKIVALDDQRYIMPFYIAVMFSNQKTKNYVDGIALHWYLDALMPTAILEVAHKMYPNKFILGTELSRGSTPGDIPVYLGNWDRAEAYAGGMIENLKNWFVGWVDWNMVLDEHGGPSFVQLVSDAPIIVNQTSDEFYKQPTFYVMGHFSKFIRPGSLRIEITQFDSQVITIAFQRPDGGIAILLVNLHGVPRDITIVDRQRKGQANLHITGHSISTFLYW